MLVIFDLDDTLFPRLPDGYTTEELNNIRPFPGVLDLLQKNNITKILITKGEEKIQNQKIDNLNVRKYFDKIFICKKDEEKKDCFMEAVTYFSKKRTDMESNKETKETKKTIKETNTETSKSNTEIFVIGDRVDSEIRWGNELGFKTIRLKQGKYKDLKPQRSEEIPDYEISEFSEINQVLLNKNKSE